MNLKKSLQIISLVLVAHAIGILFDLYGILPWYDIPMHWAGGLAMGALGLAIWNEGIEEIRFKRRFQRHIKWWLVPGVVLGFVALIGILWELHEFLLDALMGPIVGSLVEYRQPSLADTMADFVLDLTGGLCALAAFYWKK